MAPSRLIVLLALAVVALAQDPALPLGQVEVHGRWRTGADLQPFWARLLPPDPAFGGNRTLQVVYQPPPPATLGGTRLVDCPFLLLDQTGCLVAWNDRNGNSEARRQGTRYAVKRDRTPDDKADLQVVSAEVGPAPAWDRTVAPLLVALTWTPDSNRVIPVVDLYGDQPAAAVAWNRSEVLLGGLTCRAVAGPDGTLKSLVTDRNVDLLIIDERKERAP